MTAGIKPFGVTGGAIGGGDLAFPIDELALWSSEKERWYYRDLLSQKLAHDTRAAC